MLGVHVIASEADAKDVTPSRIVDELPLRMGFFAAYEFDADAGFAVNAAKAQEIQRGYWREARKKLWPALDAEYFKALETGDEEVQGTIAAQKQALRDATDTPMPDNIAGIIATWPEVLPRE